MIKQLCSKSCIILYKTRKILLLVRFNFIARLIKKIPASKRDEDEVSKPKKKPKKKKEEPERTERTIFIGNVPTTQTRKVCKTENSRETYFLNTPGAMIHSDNYYSKFSNYYLGSLFIFFDFVFSLSGLSTCKKKG